MLGTRDILVRVRIPGPNLWINGSNSAVLRIRDVYPGSRQQKIEVKKISCHTFLCSHKFHKIVNYFSFEVLKKEIWANFQTIIELFIKKIVKKLLKIWSWDPGSGKNLFRIPDPGVKKAPDPGSATLQLRIRQGTFFNDFKDLINKKMFVIFCFL